MILSLWQGCLDNLWKYPVPGWCYVPSCKSNGCQRLKPLLTFYHLYMTILITSEDRTISNKTTKLNCSFLFKSRFKDSYRPAIRVIGVVSGIILFHRVHFTLIYWNICNILFRGHSFLMTTCQGFTICRRWKVSKPMSSVKLFFAFSSLLKHMLAIEYHVYIWQVLSQLRGGDICHIITVTS